MSGPWKILERYWVIPMPEDYVPAFGYPELEGYCVVCGEHVPRLDPEATACPKRYLLPHAEILPFVVEELKNMEGGNEWLSRADLDEAAKRGRARWRESCQSGVQG